MAGAMAQNANNYSMGVQDMMSAQSTYHDTQLMVMKEVNQRAKSKKDMMTKITDMHRESTNFAFSTNDKAGKRTAQALRA